MDELDFLKNHWQKEKQFPHVKAQEIRSMLHRSSSSIVSWIFVISLLEFCLGWVITLLIPSIEFSSTFEQYFFLFTEVVFYVVILYFIYRFFRSFRAIRNTTNTKSLLSSIIQMRTHVEHYIRFNIYYFCISLFAAGVFSLSGKIFGSGNDSNSKLLLYAVVFIVIMVIVACLFVLIVRLYYRVLYGILLKRLNKNYEELRALEQEVA